MHLGTTPQGMASILAATARKTSGQDCDCGGLTAKLSKDVSKRRNHDSACLLCRTVMQKSVHHYPSNWFGTFEMPRSADVFVRVAIPDVTRPMEPLLSWKLKTFGAPLRRELNVTKSDISTAYGPDTEESWDKGSRAFFKQH